MDPLSITASVVGLTATCVQTAKALDDIASTYKQAKLTVGATVTEPTIISASLTQIQSALLRDPEALSARLQTRPELQSTFDTALMGCMVVFGRFTQRDL